MRHVSTFPSIIIMLLLPLLPFDQNPSFHRKWCLNVVLSVRTSSEKTEHIQLRKRVLVQLMFSAKSPIKPNQTDFPGARILI